MSNIKKSTRSSLEKWYIANKIMDSRQLKLNKYTRQKVYMRMIAMRGVCYKTDINISLCFGTTLINEYIDILKLQVDMERIRDDGV